MIPAGRRQRPLVSLCVQKYAGARPKHSDAFELAAKPSAKTLRQIVKSAGAYRGQQLVVFAASHSVGFFRARSDRNALNERAALRSSTHAREIRRKPVGEVHHRMHAAAGG